MSDSLLLKARELLAVEYERSTFYALAASVRKGNYDNAPEIRAIIAALRANAGDSHEE